MTLSESKIVIPAYTPAEVYIKLFHPDLETDTLPAWLKNIDLSHIPAPDFPHSLHHIETVRAYARHMARVMRLGPYWKMVLDKAAIYHDIGLSFANSGIPRGVHQVAGAVAAYMFTSNRHIAELVWWHNEDNIQPVRDSDQLSEEYLATVILRDADRIALLGYAGLLREAYYWGFRHPLMFESPHLVLNNELLCNTYCDARGLDPKHEEKIKVFVERELFPFLIKSGQIDRALNFCKLNILRFFGHNDEEISYLRELFWDKSLLSEVIRNESEIPYVFISSIGGRGLIQGINRKYMHHFIAKAVNTCEIIRWCEKTLYKQIAD